MREIEKIALDYFGTDSDMTSIVVAEIDNMVNNKELDIELVLKRPNSVIRDVMTRITPPTSVLDLPALTIIDGDTFKSDGKRYRKKITAVTEDNTDSSVNDDIVASLSSSINNLNTKIEQEFVSNNKLDESMALIGNEIISLTEKVDKVKLT